MENLETVQQIGPLRIAVIAFELITPNQRTGGVSHFNHRLCTKLSDAGHDVTAVTMNTSLDGINYRVISLFKDKNLNNRFNRFYWAPLRARKIDFSSYDLVISSGDDWAMIRRGKTWVRIMHGSAFREVQHNKKLLRKMNLSLQYLFELISFGKSSVTLFNSKDTGKFYFSRKQDKVVYLPVDNQLFHPGEKESDPTILFVGALDNRKRGRWLRELYVSSIKKRVPNAKLWMVCNPDEPMEGVTYFQHVSNEELASLYRKAHVYCMPSTYEGFGLPYLEALASGTLVVSTPNPGANEVLNDGQFGILVKDEQLADTLSDVLLRVDEHDDLINKGLGWASSHSWENVTAKYLSYIHTKS
ncbi:MAG: glycosyltransferase family 4 protein [Candidatus Pristimantibacillus sp.]